MFILDIDKVLDMLEIHKANSEVYKPYKMDGVDGKYVLLKKIKPGYSPGQIFDSQNGMVHGVWDSPNETTRLFNDTEWFMPFEEIKELS